MAGLFLGIGTSNALGTFYNNKPNTEKQIQQQIQIDALAEKLAQQYRKQQEDSIPKPIDPNTPKRWSVPFN